MRHFIPFLAATILIIPTLVGAQAQKMNLEAVLLDAAAGGQTDMVRSFLDSGANIEVKNNLGATSLIFAAIKGHSEVVELLLERGANVNAKTATGITPLIAAAAGGHEDVVKLLLAKRADVNAKDQEGRTALNLAEAAGETEVIALLKSVVKSSGPAPVAAAEPTSPARTDTIRGADGPGGLTVRAEPSRNGPVMAYLPVGSKVTYVGAASNGWVKLSSPAAGGWVTESYLGSRNLEASVVSVDNPEQCLRIRSGPGADQEKIGCLPKGAKIKITGTVQSGWAQITEPIAGWVTARQIQAPGLLPATQAASGGTRREATQGTGYRRQQSDSDDSDFTRVDRQSGEEIGQFRRENEEAQVVDPRVQQGVQQGFQLGIQPRVQQGVQPGGPQGGMLRMGPVGIGFGR